MCHAVVTTGCLLFFDSLTSGELWLSDGTLVVTVSNVDASSLGDKSTLVTNLSLVITGSDLLYNGDMLVFEATVFYDGLIAKVCGYQAVFPCQLGDIAR